MAAGSKRKRQQTSDAHRTRGPKYYGAELAELMGETAFPPRRRAGLDEADMRIIDMLVRDGRTNNRSLVDVTGLTEETVAARIRSLIERHIIGITAIFDWSAAGYEWDLYLAVECGANRVGSTASALSELEEVVGVYSVLGPVDLVAHVLCRDRAAVLEFVATKAARVDGIRNMDVMMALDTVKFFQQFTWVPLEPHPVRLIDPVVPLAQLDFDIIDHLVENGRKSNREISRALGVADGTVRSHLKKMEDAGLLHVRAQVHPARSGMIGARAFVGVSLLGVDVRERAAELADIPEIVIISITTNRFDLFCYVLAKNTSRLLEIVSDIIRPMEGVKRTETWQLTAGYKHVSHWARW